MQYWLKKPFNDELSKKDKKYKEHYENYFLKIREQVINAVERKGLKTSEYMITDDKPKNVKGFLTGKYKFSTSITEYAWLTNRSKKFLDRYRKKKLIKDNDYPKDLDIYNDIYNQIYLSTIMYNH